MKKQKCKGMSLACPSKKKDIKQNVEADVSVCPSHETHNKNKGITLIALVITIIVLLILVGVTLKLLGSDGVIAKSKWSHYVTEYGSIDEQKEMYAVNEIMAKFLNEEQNKKYPVEEEKLAVNSAEIPETLRTTILQIEQISLEELSDEKKVELHKVKMTDIGSPKAKKNYVVNVVTGTLYSLEAETYKGKIYHTPKISAEISGGTWEITYQNANGEILTTKTVYYKDDETKQVTINLWSTTDTNAEGQKLVAWSDGSTEYPLGAECTINNNKTFTGVYKSVYTVTYNENGGTSEIPTDTNTYIQGETVTVKFDPKPTKEGATFMGWATSPDATEVQYSENGTKEFTMGTENIMLYAIYQEPITAGSIAKNPKEYFGQTVNYTPPNNATSAWQIYYADTENIYLVSKDFVPISKMPAGKKGTELTAESTYSAKLAPTVVKDYVGTSNISSSNPARKWLSQLLAQYSSSSTGGKVLAYLMDTNQFSVFADSKFAEYAIAGPTFELFVRSYNAINTDIQATFTVTSTGYQYRCNLKDPTKPPSSAGYMTNIKNYNGLYNTSSSSYAWVLSGLRSGGYPIVIRATFIQNDVFATYYFRPLVCLKKGASLEKQANGTYNIVMPEVEETE